MKPFVHCAVVLSISLISVYVQKRASRSDSKFQIWVVVYYRNTPEDSLERQSFDQEYVRRLTEGDPEVERNFTDYFGDLLLIKLRSRLRSRQFVEDAKQETFLRVLTTLRKKGGLEHPERLGAFVNSVCNNVLFEFFRSESRTYPMTADGPEPADEHPDLETALVSEERNGQVRAILAELPKKDRELLKTLLLEERDKTEVARDLNVNREYLRVLLHRAKSRFRTQFLKRQAASGR